MYNGFRVALDGEMKRLRASGLGVKKRQAEPITIEEENLLWEKGVLGDGDPQTLIDTILFLCGIHFALRSGQEHRDLKISQFEVQVDQDGATYLLYTENISKNNQGRLTHRKIKQKTVPCYRNISNPERCLVRKFQKYLAHRPADCDDIFYLTSLKLPRDDTWYSKLPIRHNTLSKTVARLCCSAGITGFKTNHSLRVTTATHLFHSGADEQLIMSHTRHRSIDGVRTYKRESKDQKRSMSSVLNAASNGKPIPFEVGARKKPKLDQADGRNGEQSISYFNSQHAASTMAHTATAANFNFTGCSSITINYLKD